jgi:hypothetical protein
MSGRGVSDRNNITLGPAKLKVEEQISQTVVDQNIDFSRGTELPTELDPSVYYAVVTSYDAASLTATIVYSGDTAQVPNIANYSGFTLSVDDMVVVAQAIDNNQVIVGVRGSGDTGNEGGGGGTVDPSFPIDPFVDFGIETADQIGFAFGDLTDIEGSANSLVIHRGLGYGDVVVIDLDTGATVNIGTPIVGDTTRSAIAIINGVIYLDNGKYYDGTWNTWLLPGYVVFQRLKNSFYNKKKEQFYVHLRTSTSPFSYIIAVIDADGIRSIPLIGETYQAGGSVGYGDDQVAIIKSGTGTQPVYFYEMLPLNSAVTYGGVNDIDDYAANMLGLTDELVWSLSNGSDLFSGIYSIRLTQFNGLSIKYLDVLKSYDEDTELYRTFSFGAINRHVLDTRASIQGSPGQYVVVKPDILQDVDPAGGTFGNVSYPVIYGLTKYGVAYNIWKDLTVSTPSVTRNKVICEGLRWSAVKDRIEFTVQGKIYRVGLV